MATDLTAKEAENPKSLKDFFEKVQPGRWVRMESPIVPTATNTIEIKLPLLEIHCSTKECDGFRFFKPSNPRLYVKFLDWKEDFINYECKNCEETIKIYAVRSVINKKDSCLWMMKFGEDPPFGPPTPARVITHLRGQRRTTTSRADVLNCKVWA